MIILHGDNQVDSRKQLTLIKRSAVDKGLQLVELEANLGLDQLVSAVESNSLFGGVNTVVIEGVLSGRPSNERKAVISYLIQNQDKDVILWESKDVTTKLRDFNSKNVRRFDLPRYVFKFLDELSVNTLHLALSSAAAEQILALLAGHIGRLIMAKENQLNLPSWQLSKLKSQASKFSLDQLIKLNSQLLEIDYKTKTSQLPYDLATALELYVARI